MKLPLIRTAMFLPLLFLWCSAAGAAILVKDTVWQGDVAIAEDIVIPKGITLTIRPGATIRAAAAESTKTEPEYLSSLTELTVRGRLIVEGTERQPVVFTGAGQTPGSWAGIIVDRGSAQLSWCRISHAETGIASLGGAVTLESVTLSDNRYGVTTSGTSSSFRMNRSAVTGNDYGLFSFQGSTVTSHDSRISGNRKRDTFTAPVPNPAPAPQRAAHPDIPVGRRYGSEVLRGDTVWQGRIEVAGVIRVPEGSRLIIAPGTIVEFLKGDSNGDDIGEYGILIQGAIIAKGTREQPIVFRSAERQKAAGDWDAVNIMNSASSQNLLEYCRFEQAYRALHFHFSNVAVLNSVFSDNYRAIQFQESLVELRGNTIAGNRSGIQGRDSDITLEGNLLADNYLGANFFRSSLNVRNNRFSGNWREGIRIREGISTVSGNLFDANRFGLLLADMFFGDYSGNVISTNLETGVSIRNADNLDFAGNAVLRNGLTGVSIQESRFLVRNNLISDNGERGIAVMAFDGIIRDNNLADNGRYALDIDGPQDVSAPANWWGGDDLRTAILDKQADPARGRCDASQQLKEPVRFVWPLPAMASDTRWRGTVVVPSLLEVEKGVSLEIAPGTVVAFGRGAGMTVQGSLIAKGTAPSRILFTSAGSGEPGYWNEIQLEYAAGSAIDHAIFEYASWGVHSHFTALTISNSIFRNNGGGMRFRSGPVVFRDNLVEKNGISIRSYIGNATISGNTIRNNEVGIFVRERGAGLTISGNNIHGNTGYNIRLGDFNTEDVDARNNWWGGDDPRTGIFDARSEPGIGSVAIDPVLREPVSSGSGIMR